ncbi:putative mediator of RNA polymerase II transcription subunit 15 [Drosophila bipectinata]|uniref:putative mediator of RNA polymerase II transcription subunit 15 n=1 Tax=Drosophila bipectinata TaxID=42026 RepID=UPI001C893C08|nr:putative mediator of RNA polymerase II transcription subunit 15 [Drosophila bipectinata]
MERNNGRYPYIRRQGSSGGHNTMHSYHHHHNNNASGSSSSGTGASNAPGSYNNHSAGNNSNANTLYAAPPQQNVPLSQHDELIRYIREAWNKVYEQGTPVIYCNESDNQLKNFKPFNLEEYWGQRLVQNIHVSTTQAGGHQ